MNRFIKYRLVLFFFLIPFPKVSERTAYTIRCNMLGLNLHENRVGLPTTKEQRGKNANYKYPTKFIYNLSLIVSTVG